MEITELKTKLIKAEHKILTNIDAVLNELQDDIGNLNLSLSIGTNSLIVVNNRYSRLMITDVDLRVEI